MTFLLKSLLIGEAFADLGWHMIGENTDQMQSYPPKYGPLMRFEDVDYF